MDKEIKKKLRRIASEHHMCAENRSAMMSSETKEELATLYKRTIDWALEENVPDLDTLRENFSDCGQYGIFIDKSFDGDLLIDQPVYVFHHCKGVIRVGINMQRKIIPMLYFANDCEMTILGADGEHVRVPLYVFGPNRITSEESERLSCKIYKSEVK